MKHISYILFVAVVLALSACGGGGGGISTQPTMLSVTGVAATGLAIPSAGVSAKCQSGNGSATTTATGAYSLVISGGAMPCMLEVTNPADGTKLHSVATGSGTSAVANITPLTELVTSRLLGQDPLAYYAALSAGNLSSRISTAGITVAQADVVSALTGTVDAKSISNFISTPMVAATLASPNGGDALDKILDALSAKFTKTQISQLSTLLASSSSIEVAKNSLINILGVYRVVNQNTTQFGYYYAVGDLNGDGLDDVVSGGWTGTGISYLTVLIQNTDGTLTDRTAELVGSNQYPGSMHVFINDFDGDGYADIWFPGGDDMLPSAASVMLWGSASGKFTRQQVDNGIASHGGCVADLNGDGNLDLLVQGTYDQNTNTSGYYTNNGNRLFSTLVPHQFVTGASSCAVIRDVATGHLAVLQGGSNQMPGYESSINIVDANLNLIKQIGIIKQDTTMAGLITAIPVDVNGDGLVDLVLAWENFKTHPYPGRKEVWLNQGNDNFVYGYTLDTTHNMPGDWASFTYQNELYVFFNAPGGDAVLYRRESGKLVPYKTESFTAMLTALGADPITGAWLGAHAVASATVYRGRDGIYMLQKLASGLYTKKL